MFAPLNKTGVPSLSEKERLILSLLVEHGELFGLALVEQSDGELRRGTVYVTLDRMEDKGFVTSRTEEKPAGTPGLPRRLYKPTGLGEQILKAYDLASSQLNKLVKA